MMRYKRCDYWDGTSVCDGEINLDRYAWWCPECEMAVKDCHAEGGVCPRCETEMNDMDYQRGVWDEYSDGPGNQLEEDEEGNCGYP